MVHSLALMGAASFPMVVEALEMIIGKIQRTAGNTITDTKRPFALILRQAQYDNFYVD